ncbi:MAG: hypothetical protein CRN43_08530 [Candidatus Nephrothrix sp. EaCA]|nr:MAG: hypothetical protein CRN43_08530 [Candidatus Nephrothrix sp. EaCA]
MIQGHIIRTKRGAKALRLRQAAAQSGIAQTIPTTVLDIGKEKLTIQFLDKKMAYEIAGNDCAPQALKAAAKKVRFIQVNRK